MPKNSKPLFGLLVGGSVLGLMWYLYGGIQNALVTFSGIKFNKINLTNSSVFVQIRIINPANGSITIKHVLGDVYANDTLIGNLEGLNINKEISGNGATTLDILLKISNLSAFLVIRDSVMSTKKAPNLTVNYSISTNFAPITGTATLPIGS